MKPRQVVALIAAFALFLLSIQAIRAGGRVPAGLLSQLADPISALGMGWLGAYLAMAGSPIAALAVALHGTASISASALLAMIGGSRLGAEAIVLVTGGFALLRGRRAPARQAADRRGVEVGFLAFLVSFTVYVPAILLSLLVLSQGTPSISAPGSASAAGLTAITTAPIIARVVQLVGPGWTVLLGVAGLWTAFRLFERSLPTPKSVGPFARAAKRMLLHPSLTFLLGAAVTLVVTTVSISMTLLIPLHMRGYVTRGQMAAYMLGAGVTTLVDTWVVAVVSGDAVAQGVILLLGGLVLALSVTCLAVFPWMMKGWNHALDAMTTTPRRMLLAGAGLILVPVALVLV